MPVSVEAYLYDLYRYQIADELEIRRLLRRLSPWDRPTSGEELAATLVRHGKVTKYQAKMIYHGKASGLVLGDYLLQERIGRGGAGVVFKAVHRLLQRTVALKVLPPEARERDELRQRFEREIRLAARLHHPNIIAVFDARVEKGVPLLAMEYVRGPTLTALVEHRGVLPVARAIDYIWQTARGLDYAHRRGVIHRDVKPDNLLLARDEIVKIFDLGVARSVRVGDPATSDDRSDLTKAGHALGSIPFMAPEQAVDPAAADERADVFALGATLYYLLTGEVLFHGKTVVETMVALWERPVPCLATVRPDAPTPLVEAYRRMTAKDPADRCRSMGEVLGMLTPLLGWRPEHAESTEAA